MARLTDTNMTAAERKVFAHLVQAVGFAPKVMFGRDRSSANHIVARLMDAADQAVLYAVATRSTPSLNGVREYRLLIAPVAEPHPSDDASTPVSAYSRQWRHKVGQRVHESWEARRKKYGPSGRRPFPELPHGGPKAA